MITTLEQNEGLQFTILTESLGFTGCSRELVKSVLGRHKRYGGHSAVTKGLIEGLNKIGYKNYNYRPRANELYETVHVLSGVNTLRYAIRLKQDGKIKNLSVGPNVVVSSSDYSGLIASEEIDLCITPSEWVSNSYLRFEPSLQGRITSWPVGVDMDFFNPTTPFASKSSQKVLVYQKDESEHFSAFIINFLESKGYDVSVLKCGSYTLDQYRDMLEKASFMVTLSRQESQGIFYAEAWSMDVPTICCDRGYYRSPGESYDVDISSCPYVTDENGQRFRNAYELNCILEKWNEIKAGFNPRKWCETNMSDVACARKFVDILNSRFL